MNSLRDIMENLKHCTVGSLRIEEREAEEITAETASKYAEFADFLLCKHRIERFWFFASEEMLSRLPNTFLAYNGIQALLELKFSVVSDLELCHGPSSESVGLPPALTVPL